MDTIKSHVRTDSPEYKANFENHQNLSLSLKRAMESVSQGGGDEAVQKHRARGKRLARERVERIVDPGTHFMEFSGLAANGLYGADGNDAPSAGIVTGIGCVHDREVLFVANDATVKGGTYYPMTVKKHLRAQEIALENHLPCVYLVDSGGAFLPLQAEVFPDKEHFGRIFYNQARMSARRIPQVAVVLGSCTAGGAYVPAMSDETIIVKNQGTIFLGGPPLVKAATGEEVSAEDLGGGEVHSRKSGVTDHLADSEDHALELTRRLLTHLNRPAKTLLQTQAPEEPLYDPREIYGILPTDARKARSTCCRLWTLAMPASTGGSKKTSLT